MCGPAPGPNARPRPAGVPLFGCLPLIIAQFAYRRNGDLRTRGGGPQSLPRKGLRSRAPPAADTARRSRCSGRRTQVCFSARSAMRAPQTGRWMRRKAQTEGCIAAWRRKYPAKPGRALPRIRRGRCSHRPATPAIPQTPSGGRNRPPYKAAGSGRQRTNVSHPPSPPAGRCNHRPLRRGRSGRSAREAARRRGTVCRPPFRRPSALHCRAGVHARRGALS